MATVNIGNIKLNWKGAYNGSTAYAIDDVVSYNGSSYVCIQASTGNLPTVTAYWEQMSAKGVDADLMNIASTAQGDIYYNNGSAIARLGAGTSGQFLKTQGTGANPTWSTLASNVDIVTSKTDLGASGVTSIVQTLDWSTNNYYKVEFYMNYEFDAISTSRRLDLRMRNSSGSITTDSYGYIGYYSHSRDDNSSSAEGLERDLDGNRTSISINGWGMGDNKVDNFCNLTFYKPDNNNRQSVEVRYYVTDNSNPDYHTYYLFNAFCNHTDAKTGFEIYPNAGDVRNGYYTVIGHKHT